MPRVTFERLLEALAANRSNTLEYYEDDRIHVKSFASLYADVMELADRLEALGVTPGRRVGLWFENDYFWVVLDLACLAVGATSVPFHASIRDLDAREAMRTFELAALFTASDVCVPDGEGFAAMPRPTLGAPRGGGPRPRELARWEPSSVFTVLFTSGTTGFPKALEVRVTSVTDFLDTASRLFELRPDDKVIVFMPLSHFGQRSYIYAAIVLGFDIALVPANAVFAAFRRSRPTLLVAVPFFFDGLYRAFRNTATAEPLRRFLGGAMRLMITGSAPIRREVLEFFDGMGFTLYEGYGTTESGLIALNYPGACRLGSVGRVFPNKDVRIGEGGEVLVRGEFCWADRYLNQPDAANAEVFGADGYIRTGDIGYFDADGFLHLSGRRKEMMVFSNGSKAHPAEIESSLQRHDEVLQACVFSAADSVCAVIVPTEGVASERVKSIVDRANTMLPDYARIQRYVISAEPFSSENGLLTASLKLNRPQVASRFAGELAPQGFTRGRFMLEFTPLEDWPGLIERLTSFIAASAKEQNAQGVLLGLSGGIDSAVVAALAARAVGPERVHACLLPDMDSADDMLVDARRVVDWLGLTHVETRDISPVVQALGVYDLFPDIYALPKEERARRVGDRKRMLLGAGRENGNGGGAFLQDYRQKAHAEMNRIRSLWNAKIRCRMVILYSKAELHKLTVLGTTNRSEYLTGWFTKYGDGAVDVEVILPLYKTRVFELAERLSVPEAIRTKVPTGDILPGISDEDMLGVRYAVLDRILLGLERKVPPAEIGAELGTDTGTVERVAGLIASSRFSRMPALAPEIAVD